METTRGTSTTTAPAAHARSAPDSLPASQRTRPGDDRSQRDDRQPLVPQLPNLLGDEGDLVDGYQLLASVRSCGRREADAGVHHHGPSGKAEHGVEIELRELGEVVGELREPVQHVGERRRVGGRSTAEARDQPAGLACADELVRVDVRQRSEPEVSFPDELREHAAGAEGDERAEHGILGHAGEQLHSALDHRLHDHRAADALGRRPHGFRRR